MLDAFRSRAFRYYWAGLTVSNIGAWMQIFALGILVVQIAERDGVPELAPLYLGLMGLARAVPGLLFTLVAGAVADRVDRRRLLLVTQTTMAANAAVLAIVAFAGWAAMWNVLLAATIQSAAFAFDNPSRQSMVPRLVPMAVLPSAIGLQSAAFNGASIIGPVLAGALYLPIGIPGILAANALSFLAIIAALLVLPALPPAAVHARSLLSSVAEGARYIRGNTVLVWILTVAGTGFVLAGPVSALLPALAGETFWNGMSWLSLLLAAMGAGAFAAALVVMNIARLGSLGSLFTWSAVLNGAALVLFAFAPTPQLALVFAFLTGLGSTLMAGAGNNMLQATTDDSYRGRVMSVWGLLFIGIMPVGQLGLGVLGSLLGVHAALVFGGVLTLAAGLYARVRISALGDWRHPSRAPTSEPTVAVGNASFR